eukprot:TRINITY_DN10910_c0_g1_i4.p4 TRINITY_DN10910_c0_g1~~TRINITY_DN10910_c0_g1_i4.p4  ORF type:complete len:114 (+),score=32.11 TRINITY_DN10910_c0_g1_i4:2165-2506(+)
MAEDRKQAAEKCRIMFEKTSKYIEQEVANTCSEYELLQKMNAMAADEYEAMSKQMQTTNETAEELKQSYESLAPFVAHIDDLYTAVSNLHQQAQDLDQYSRALEARLKQAVRR